ncbi:uncharacterized protein LOC131881443 [Tigriopus californicus]|uniref:uncharacterized protein LOC131881443 n=1 Tax=Tigriopus californicus TaxID=6832 RepID=UPI0027DA738E|nr:uncharacterized protein LOC131881443 [Tigriopus californicus]
MSASISSTQEGLGGSSQSDPSLVSGNQIQTNKKTREDTDNQKYQDDQKNANVDEKPKHPDDTDSKPKGDDDSSISEENHRRKDGHKAIGANGVVTAEDISKSPMSSQSRYGHGLKKCSVPLKDISLCRDPILKDLYQGALKRVKKAPPPPKPKNTLYPDFSPKEIPLPLLFPGLSPPVLPPPKTSVKGKRGGDGKRGQANSYRPPPNSQLKPKYNRRPLPVRPSLPYVEPIFVKPAYLNHAERLMNASFGPFGRVNAAELVALCKELDDARGMVNTLRSQLTNVIMGVSETEKNDLKRNVMNLADLPEPKLNKTENMMAPSGYRIIDLQLMSLALDAAQRCEHENSNRKLQIFEMHSNQLNQDLAKSFAFVCTVCKKATVFPNSSFSKEWPPNYSVNKQFLQILGTKPFQRTVNFIRKGEKPSPLLPRFSSDPAQLVLSIDQKSYKGNFLPPSPPHPAQPSRSPPRTLPRVNLLNGRSGKSGKTKIPTKIKASPLLPVGSRISVIPPGTQVSGHVNFTTAQETGLKPGVYRVNTTGYPERIIAVKDEEIPTSDGCIDLDSVAGPSSSLLDRNINTLQDPIATSSSMGTLADDDEEDDPPDFSHFLDVSLGGGDSSLMGADSLIDQNSSSSHNQMDPRSQDNEAKPTDFMGWQNDDNRIVEDMFADPLQPEVTLGSDSNYNVEDDSDDDYWEGERSRKRTRKRKMNQSKTSRPKKSKNIIPEEIILS